MDGAGTTRSTFRFIARLVVSAGMAGANSSESPLESIAGTIGERTIEAFEILGNETRLAILLALWEASEPFDRDDAVPFSALYDRVEMGDSGNFTYHLDRLAGVFVEEADAGYRLTNRAEHVLRAILAGTLAGERSFEGESIDARCDRCDSSMLIDYRDGMLFERCSSCGGRWGDPEYPPGVMRSVYRPPVGLEHRSPQEFHRHGNTWDRYDFMSRLEGVCPDCSGSVTASFARCESHDVDDGTVCDHCRSFWEIQLRTVCEICKAAAQMAPFAPIHTDLRVKAFYHEHGLNPDERYDAADTATIRDTIAEKTVVSEDPREVLIAIAIDGDRLEMTLDETADVIDVRRIPG